MFYVVSNFNSNRQRLILYEEKRTNYRGTFKLWVVALRNMEGEAIWERQFNCSREANAHWNRFCKYFPDAKTSPIEIEG